jgi:hypothetical protein
LEAKLAGVPKYGLAVALDMLVEPDAGTGLGHYRASVALPTSSGSTAFSLPIPV